MWINKTRPNFVSDLSHFVFSSFTTFREKKKVIFLDVLKCENYEIPVLRVFSAQDNIHKSVEVVFVLAMILLFLVEFLRWANANLSMKYYQWIVFDPPTPWYSAFLKSSHSFKADFRARMFCSGLLKVCIDVHRTFLRLFCFLFFFIRWGCRSWRRFSLPQVEFWTEE